MPSRVGTSARRFRETWREHPGACAFFASALLLGIVLRLSFSGDIEYKGDEWWTFHTAMGILGGSPWPSTGMGSSAGIPNPGFSVWIFPVLAWLTRATTPIEVARAVQLMNCAALVALFAFASISGREHQVPWAWTAALAAVDPLGIVLQRKIWAQSVLPLLAWAFFLAWRQRQGRRGAFAWGLLGILLGQFHMSGFFYALVFLAWSGWAAWRPRSRQPVAWSWWAIGTAFGAVPLAGWVGAVLRSRHVSAAWQVPSYMAGNAWRLWMEDALGWNLAYSLGPDHLKRFKAWPLWHGQPTRLVEASLAASGILVAAVAVGLLYRIARERRRVLDPFRAPGPIAHNLAFFGYGLLMNALPLTFFRHYLLVAFPFTAMTIPLLAFAARMPMRLVGVIWVAHAFIAAALLFYLHAHHGAPGGDYGVAFQFQGRHVR